MAEAESSGLYGKLPGYGDFIFRNLKTDFINAWDEWLQHFLSASKEQIGEGWLDIYLTSPIWRFVLSSGVVDHHVYAGVMMPSVDSVGRYFPLTAVTAFPHHVNPVEIMLGQSKWFQAMEEQCLSSLNGEIDADELATSLSKLSVSVPDMYVPSPELGDIGSMVFTLSSCSDVSVQSLLPYAYNASLCAGLSSFSMWMTNGSEHISPMLFSCQGLPPIRGIGSMLDGRWQERSWKVPYNLQAI